MTAFDWHQVSLAPRAELPSREQGDSGLPMLGPFARLRSDCSYLLYIHHEAGASDLSTIPLAIRSSGCVGIPTVCIGGEVRLKIGF